MLEIKNLLLNPNHLYLNGVRYVGEWKEDKFHGNGSFKYLNGDKYNGGWKMDQEMEGMFTTIMANIMKVDGKTTKKMVMVKWISLMVIGFLGNGKMV